MLMMKKVALTFKLLIFVCMYFSLCGATKVSLKDIEISVIQGHYDTAEAQAVLLLKEGVDQSERDTILYYLGLSRLHLGKHREARESFGQVVAKQSIAQSLWEKAQLGIVDSYYLEGNFTDGLRMAEELLQKSQQSQLTSLIYLKVARGNLKLARWEKAKTYLKKIQTRYPKSLEAHTAKQLLEEKQFFSVQVGAFLERSRAEGVVEDLYQKGEYAFIIETVDRKDRKFYRVRVGELTQLEDAQELKSKLVRFGYPTQIYP